jgi:predicted small metal-binding protein
VDVSYSQTCPRCGLELSGDDPAAVADAVVAHARDEHRHRLDREIVLAHLEGVRPDEREP